MPLFAVDAFVNKIINNSLFINYIHFNFIIKFFLDKKKERRENNCDTEKNSSMGSLCVLEV